MPKYEIDIKKKYIMPADLRVVHYKNKILVIAPKFANWIVIDNPQQLSIFEYLRSGHSIGETLSVEAYSNKDVSSVVTQIEARQLCSKDVHNITDEERDLHIYLTNKCNMTCPHCYMYAGKANQNELSTEEIFSLLKNHKDIAKGTSVTLSGGEPTIRKDFDVIVEFAYKIGLEVKVLTNGTLFTFEQINKLAKWLYSVQISIDGFSEETNSQIRGKGNFDRALKTIDYFVNCGVNASVAIAPPMDLLRVYRNEYVDFAKKLSEQYHTKPLSVRFAEELIPGREISPSRSFTNEYYNLVKSIQEQLYEFDYELMNFVRKLNGDAIINNCQFGKFAIASNGDVYLCARIGDLSPIANVRNVSFDEILEITNAVEKNTHVRNLHPCNNCELCYICGGGCRIEEFPDVITDTPLRKVSQECEISRVCSAKIKEKFYDLMIRSNKYFYKEPK